ncbi:MAG: hypothetical protein HZC29_06295 [Thaumarchaeota archaeon]|nr:hypothetical protein [Nitrososphaerota archaeon]
MAGTQRNRGNVYGAVTFTRKVFAGAALTVLLEGCGGGGPTDSGTGPSGQRPDAAMTQTDAGTMVTCTGGRSSPLMPEGQFQLGGTTAKFKQFVMVPGEEITARFEVSGQQGTTRMGEGEEWSMGRSKVRVAFDSRTTPTTVTLLGATNCSKTCTTQLGKQEIAVGGANPVTLSVPISELNIQSLTVGIIQPQEAGTRYPILTVKDQAANIVIEGPILNEQIDMGVAMLQVSSTSSSGIPATATLNGCVVNP